MKKGKKSNSSCFRRIYNVEKYYPFLLTFSFRYVLATPGTCLANFFNLVSKGNFPWLLNRLMSLLKFYIMFLLEDITSIHETSSLTNAVSPKLDNSFGVQADL